MHWEMLFLPTDVPLSSFPRWSRYESFKREYSKLDFWAITRYNVPSYEWFHVEGKWRPYLQ